MSLFRKAEEESDLEQNGFTFTDDSDLVSSGKESTVGERHINDAELKNRREVARLRKAEEELNL